MKLVIVLTPQANMHRTYYKSITCSLLKVLELKVACTFELLLLVAISYFKYLVELFLNVFHCNPL